MLHGRRGCDTSESTFVRVAYVKYSGAYIPDKLPTRLNAA
jgi:hypothetical protein